MRSHFIVSVLTAGFLTLAPGFGHGHRSPDTLPAAHKTEHAAIVVANSDYPDSDMSLPVVSGAKLFADALWRRGYEVKFVQNGGRQALMDALNETTSKLWPSADVVVWFSGYAAQSRDHNYLLPVDASIWSERDVRTDGIAVDEIVDALRRAGAQQSTVFIDASRRNPFERRFRAYSHGLAAAENTKDSIIVTSLPANTVGYDSTTAIDPFAAAIVSDLGMTSPQTPNALAGAAHAAAARATAAIQAIAAASAAGS